MRITIDFDHENGFFIFTANAEEKQLQYVQIPDDLATERYDNEKWAIEGMGLVVISRLEKELKAVKQETA